MHAMKQDIRYRRNRKTTYRVNRSIVYILDETTNTIHTLNETASFIWQNMEKPITLPSLTAKMTAAYDVTEARAKKDIMELLQKYIRAGYVEPILKSAGKSAP